MKLVTVIITAKLLLVICDAERSVDDQQNSCQLWNYGLVYRGPCPDHEHTKLSGDEVGDCHLYAIKNRLQQQQQQQQQQQPQQQPQQTQNASVGGGTCLTTDRLVGTCQPPTYCYFQYDNHEIYSANQCIQTSGSKGICCPNKEIREPSAPSLPIHIPVPIVRTAQIPYISQKEIDKAAREARKVIDEYLKLEKELEDTGFFQLNKNSMEAKHQAFFGPQTPQTRKLSSDGLIVIETSLRLAKNFNLQPEQARDGLPKYNLKRSIVSDVCIKEPKCNEKSKYRTVDGSCNYFRSPLSGKSNTIMKRLIPPAYADGLNTPRVASDGGALPSARDVSLSLALDRNVPDRKLTLVIMQWGQFIDHDLSLAANTRLDSPEGRGLMCCLNDLESDEQLMHPACFIIPVRENDPFYSKFHRRCISFVRNAPNPRPGCTLGPREQGDQLTQIIDGSQIYGSTEDRASYLRLYRSGLMRFSIVNNDEFLPFDVQNKSDQCAAQNGFKCFVGGDVRVNEQTGLTAMHILWLREHNRIARVLGKLNPSWNDENVYQETRRIVAAQIQHITYNEWTPLVLGRRTMKQFNLMLEPSGFSSDYDSNLKPGILTEWATAAYRFHTLIQGLITLLDNQGYVKHTLMLRNIFGNPESLYEPGNFDGFLNAMTMQPVQTFDQFFTEEVTNHVFEEHGTGFGMDLITLNIQRGRDHGIPDYNQYRKICGLSAMTQFEDMRGHMRPGSEEKFASMYQSVNDIDLFVGLNHEMPVPDGIVGPTMACILAEQARRNKVSDRFWYENGNLRHSFSEAQLNEIRKVSFSRIVCNNADAIDHIQPLAFLQSNPLWNPRIECSKIASVDLKHWQNEPVDN